jgi:nucleoside-diphosphate-sugar epimerase
MRALVTGPGGFLGGAIARRLLDRGDHVKGLARGSYPELEAKGIELLRGDLSNAADVSLAAQDCDVVFHVAAKAGIWGPEAEYRKTNVDGTQNIINACLEHKIPRLVYTSTPSVVFNGRDMEAADESTPYSDHFLTAYPRTKAEAERLVLLANGATLATVALRPHLIWGPGDNHLVPRIIARGRAGMLRKIGSGTNLVDAVYIDDAADAHILAADLLAPNSPIAGKAYFITGGEPIALWDLVNGILAAADVPPVTRSIPEPIAYVIGSILELIHTITGNPNEPRMTRFLARELATAHWFNIDAARRDLGFQPKVSITEGLKRLRASLQTD